MNTTTLGFKSKIVTIFSFDVELYFGNKPGSTSKNIIEPIEALLNLAAKTGIHFTFFVDAGHLNYLERSQAQSSYLGSEYTSLAKLIQRMKLAGHDIQLHVHPHWEDANFDGTWHFNNSRFSPSAFSESEYFDLFGRYKLSLETVMEQPATAFRAGGFCFQKYDGWHKIFSHYEIGVDSSIYFGGYEKSRTHFYDFRSVPRDPYWYFENQPTEVLEQGRFLEVPVTSMYFSPYDFLSILAARKLKNTQNNVIGDGQSAATSFHRKVVYLLKGDNAPASVDSGKSNFLNKYRADCANRSCNLLHLMGHPKAISLRSLMDIADYCNQHGNNNIMTLSDYASSQV